MRTILLSFLTAILLAPAAAIAVTPAKPPMPTMTEKEAAKVADGKLVLMKESIAEGDALVTGIIEIEAQAQAIWDIVLDNQHMVDASGAVKEVTTYKDETGADGLRDLRLAFMMKVGFSEIRFHSHRTVNTADGWMSWELDDDRDNDIKATVGSYSMWPGSQAGHQMFVYKARIETGKRVPEWLEEELTESSLKKFLLYVKRVAEEE